MSRYLIVGLGNPGSKYAGTRHNIGFEAVEELGRRRGIRLTQEKFAGRFQTGRVGPHAVVLLEPMTFMNRSGRSVQAAAQFYGVAPSEIIVLHDDIDLALGTLRLKQGGGHGGHNGLRDIIEKLGTRDFGRVRLGVGRPTSGDVTSHVLGKFGRAERGDVEDLLDRACSAIEVLLEQGMAQAQQTYH